MTDTSITRDAAVLWDFLQKQGGLDLARYDDSIAATLLDELVRMGKPPEASLDALLKQGTVSVEELLVAFFRSVQPYSMMMAEMLRFFENAGAKLGNNNISLEFDFTESEKLGLDLNNFRQQTQRWLEVLGEWIVNAWSIRQLWELRNVFRYDAEARPILGNATVAAWLRDYRGRKGKGRYPAHEPASPRSGNPELDDTIEQVWNLWLSVVRTLKAIEPDREALRELWWSANRDRPDNLGSGLWSAEVIMMLESDMWPATLAEEATAFAESVAALPQNQQPLIVAPVVTKVKALFDSVPKRLFKGLNFTRELSDLLNLPIWKHRHELYSAWVSTRITGALNELDPEIQAPNGTLAFAFKATQLAKFNRVSSPLHLWSELRTPLAYPSGHSRSGGIQPDYSLTRDTVDSLSSVFVVECKQYWKQSTRNFADALNDYARGRPKAHVVLVNYGPISPNLINHVDAAYHSRISFVGGFRPGQPSSLVELEQQLRKSIIPVFGIPQPVPPPVSEDGSFDGIPLVPTAPPGEVTVTWGDQPQDLDLHLRIGPGGGVDYLDKGVKHQAPWAELELDQRAGRGPEIIRITRWFDTHYLIAVNAFTREVPLSRSGAIVTLTIGHSTHRFICPAIGDGSWWLVCTYEPRTGKLETHNRIVNGRANGGVPSDAII